eukprot:6211019-Pleurochrysis_carterae.AAC.3
MGPDAAACGNGGLEKAACSQVSKLWLLPTCRHWQLKEERKLRSSVPDISKGIVPADHPFTCESVFLSMLREEFPPLYSLDGTCAVDPADARLAIE